MARGAGENRTALLGANRGAVEDPGHLAGEVPAAREELSCGAVGRDVGRPASDDYTSPDTFTGGTIEKVTVAVKGQPHTDPEKQAAMANHRD